MLPSTLKPFLSSLLMLNVLQRRWLNCSHELEFPKRSSLTRGAISPPSCCRKCIGCYTFTRSAPVHTTPTLMVRLARATIPRRSLLFRFGKCDHLPRSIVLYCFTYVDLHDSLGTIVVSILEFLIQLALRLCPSSTSQATAFYSAEAWPAFQHRNAMKTCDD